MQHVRSLVLLLVCASLSACGASTWSPRTIPACYTPSGSSELDRERTYYALLLALSERKYIILHAEPSRQVEVEYHSSYKPEQAYARWLIDIREDSSLLVQSLPAQAEVSHKRMGHLEQWFGMLSESTRRLHCRDLNWLRWEAQNRGLVPMTEGLTQASPASAGAEVPPAPAAQPAAASEQARAARIRALQQERNEISLVTPIALLGTGAGMMAGAAVLTQFAVLESQEECVSDPVPDGGFGIANVCGNQKRNYAIGAGALAFGALTLVAIGAPLLARRLRRKSAIGRELRVLEPAGVALGPHAHGIDFAYRTRF